MRRPSVVTQLTTILLGCMFFSLSAMGDNLALPDTAPDAVTTHAPTRGMLMSQVESTYGTPTQRAAAVGKPPITRWDYPNFAVFFEYEHVIHSVIK